MPTVPLLETPTVNLATESTGNFAATAVQPMENYGAAQQAELGNKVVAAAAQAMRIGEHIQNQIDTAKTKEYDMQFADKIREVMYNPESGYMNAVGKNAVERRKDTAKAIADARKEIEGGLENDVQRLMFKQSADRRVLAANTDIDQHGLQQLKVYNVGESKARVDNLMDDAVVNAKNWQQEGSQYKMFKGAMDAEVGHLADLQGIPRDSEQYKEMQRAASTKLHGTVISNFISQENPNAAEQYLNAHKSEIDTDKLDQIQNAVRSAKETIGVKDESLRLSFDIKGGSLTDQISRVDDMYKNGKISAQVRDATVQRIEHNYSVSNQQQNDYNKSQMGAAQDWIMNNPGKSIMDMPTPLYSWAKQEGHLAALDGFAQREGRPADRQKELKMRGELLNMATNDDTVGQFVDEFKRTGFQDRTDLGAQGIKEMQNIAMQIVQNNGRWKTTFDQKQLQDGIPGNLLKSSKKDKKDAFVAIMSEKQQEWVKANPGKSPKPEDYRSVISAANEEYVSLGFFNRPKKAYEIRASEGTMSNAVPKWFFDQGRSKNLSSDQILRAWQTYSQGKK